MPGCARHHRHELDRRGKETRKAFCREVDRQSRPQVFLLGRDADRAVVRVAGAHAEAADRLQRCVRYRDSVCAKRQCLGEVGRMPQAAGGD